MAEVFKSLPKPPPVNRANRPVFADPGLTPNLPPAPTNFQQTPNFPPTPTTFPSTPGGAPNFQTSPNLPTLKTQPPVAQFAPTPVLDLSKFTQACYHKHLLNQSTPTKTIGLPSRDHDDMSRSPGKPLPNAPKGFNNTNNNNNNGQMDTTALLLSSGFT